QGPRVAGEGLRGCTGDAQPGEARVGPDGVGVEGLGAAEPHDIEHRQNQLAPGVQLVGQGISGEKLAQGDVLEHLSTYPLSLRSGPGAGPPPCRLRSQCPRPAAAEPWPPGSPGARPAPPPPAPRPG